MYREFQPSIGERTDEDGVCYLDQTMSTMKNAVNIYLERPDN